MLSITLSVSCPNLPFLCYTSTSTPGEPTPTPTSTSTPGEPTPTPTSTSTPGEPTPTPTSTSTPGEPTPTPTSTSTGGGSSTTGSGTTGGSSSTTGSGTTGGASPSPTGDDFSADSGPDCPDCEDKWSKLNFYQYFLEKVSTKFPFDIGGTLPTGLSKCPSVSFYGRSKELCEVNEFLKYFKFPVWILFLIRGVLSL
ncbi:hypothetical protein V0288_17885, partial [Pannus brasiliensis CCIBt3594]